MVLSNAERQARYRERLRQLASRGVMSPLQADLLADTRLRLREWRRSIAMFAEGRMRLRTNNVDTTDQHVTMLRGIIAQNEKLLAQYDPDDVTVDGNIEIGEVTPQESGGMFAGRWVAFSMDEQGCAIQLRFYEAESAARTDASAHGRCAGMVADDMWSIITRPE